MARMRPDNETKNSPTSKCFTTSSPATSKWLFLGMGSFMSLHMFNTPKMETQCKLICDRAEVGEEGRAVVNSPEALAAILARESLWLLLPGFPAVFGSTRSG